MPEETFALERFEEFAVGDVYRMNEHSAFPDTVILGLSAKGNARVARPYAYASSVGTTCPTVLLGAEVYALPVDHLRKHFRKMDTGRTV